MKKGRLNKEQIIGISGAASLYNGFRKLVGSTLSQFRAEGVDKAEEGRDAD